MAQVEIRKLKIDGDSNTNESKVPLCVDWNNVSMARYHSIRAAAKEILNISKSTGAVQVNLVGMPGQGKSTLAETLAHLIHTFSEAPFTVKHWGRKELLNVKQSVEDLEPTNHILIYDDISYLQSGKVPKEVIDDVTKAMTEIRHLKGIDVQIISILCFHYSYAIPKSLRNAQYWFYLSVGSSELENVIKLVGVKNTQKIMEFRKVHSQAQNYNKFVYWFGKRKVIYQQKKPFCPALFWNGDTLRHIVFPKRDWIDLFCNTCTGKIENPNEIADLEQMKTEALKKFGIGVIRQALRMKLLSLGVNCYPVRATQCMRYFEDYLKHKQFSPEKIAECFDLEPTNTKNRNKIPDEIASIPTRPDSDQNL